MEWRSKFDTSVPRVLAEILKNDPDNNVPESIYDKIGINLHL